jgi:carbonic anhydrase
VPETTILGLQPGEVFVHRNVANIINPTDLNTISVIEYAVRYVKVKHIIVCGHTNCAGCVGTLANAELGGVLDTWLTALRAIRDTHEPELTAISDPAERAIRLAELSVAAGTRTVMANKAVQEAVNERGLQVHTTIYTTATGLLRDLGLGTGGKHVASIVKDVQHVAPEQQRETVRGNHGVLEFSGGEAKLTVG